MSLDPSLLDMPNETLRRLADLKDEVLHAEEHLALKKRLLAEFMANPVLPSGESPQWIFTPTVPQKSRLEHVYSILEEKGSLGRKELYEELKKRGAAPGSVDQLSSWASIYKEKGSKEVKETCY